MPHSSKYWSYCSLLKGTGSLRPWISTVMRKSTGPRSGLFLLVNIRFFRSVRALKCTCGVWSSWVASLINHPCSSSLLDVSVCLWSLWLNWPFPFWTHQRLQCLIVPLIGSLWISWHCFVSVTFKSVVLAAVLLGVLVLLSAAERAVAIESQS